MKIVMKQSEIRRALLRIIHEILEKNKGIRNLVFIGIKRRGDYVARRLADMIKQYEGKKIPLGALDITLYRDDLQLVSETPIIESTDIPFDVLYTGRTIRAAMEELFNFGRPKAIQLAVLVDRGHRELPIQADFVGKSIPTAKNEIVDVHIEELDAEDCVIIQQYRKRTRKRKDQAGKTGTRKSTIKKTKGTRS